MNRNVKLGLAGFGFLGANGALVPVVNGNFSLPNLSFSELGGGISYQSDSSNRGYESSKLNLGGEKSTETSINLDSSKSDLPAPKLNLEEQGDSSLNLNSDLSASSSISSSIGRIHTEIGREERVEGINQQLESQYTTILGKRLESTQDKQEVHIQNFQDAKRQIQGQTGSRKGKREAQPVSLTQAHREAISRMFQLQSDLKDKSKELSKQLEDEFFNGLREALQITSPEAQSQTSPVTAEEIKKSLQRINWTGQYIETQKSRARRSTEFYNAKSWGKWTENPFRHFYSQEKDFEEAIKSLQKNAMNVYNTKQSQARMQQAGRNRWYHVPQMWKVIEKQYKAINKKISELEDAQDSHIVNQVAQFLLQYMGQT
ncbi:hypothetical protein OVS_02885 [Mycoplasma ovis str. Michigan]|uniref:Uncharacterized protein n=1 Tax=Mycoplasma ovis str. Michigan TaxID=1415773 RepID=A0ABN4BR58_9MOLU|nr:hypothetical protein [Mycoplasma ovis]AHC40369.1 hypothetical protein OVS_02885 [Mycoplasma ovis str. Michigan]